VQLSEKTEKPRVEVMAPNPDYLEANWSKVKAVRVAEGRLDRLAKEIIEVAVSAVNACDY
jgi:alkylhydroperoxidase family enzyme